MLRTPEVLEILANELERNADKWAQIALESSRTGHGIEDAKHVAEGYLYASALRTRATALRSLAAGEAQPSFKEREEKVMREWRIGNLTKLGVANYLVREGFNQRVAVEKANALAAGEAQHGG